MREGVDEGAALGEGAALDEGAALGEGAAHGSATLRRFSESGIFAGLSTSMTLPSGCST
jgi:hypothetical protein